MEAPASDFSPPAALRSVVAAMHLVAVPQVSMAAEAAVRMVVPQVVSEALAN